MVSTKVCLTVERRYLLLASITLFTISCKTVSTTAAGLRPTSSNLEEDISSYQISPQQNLVINDSFHKDVIDNTTATVDNVNKSNNADTPKTKTSTEEGSTDALPSVTPSVTPSLTPSVAPPSVTPSGRRDSLNSQTQLPLLSEKIEKPIPHVTEPIGKESTQQEEDNSTALIEQSKEFSINVLSNGSTLSPKESLSNITDVSLKSVEMISSSTLNKDHRNSEYVNLSAFEESSNSSDKIYNGEQKENMTLDDVRYDIVPNKGIAKKKIEFPTNVTSDISSPKRKYKKFVINEKYIDQINGQIFKSKNSDEAYLNHSAIIPSTVHEDNSVVFPKKTTTLTLEANSSQFEGYSEDPFQVLDILKGKFKNIEILDESKDRKSSNHIFFPKSVIASDQNKKVAEFRSTNTSPISKAQVESRSVDDLVTSFRPIANSSRKDEIMSHDGVAYIRKNFLIMPLNKSQSDAYVQSLTTPSSNSVETSSTPVSLLNQRVPIYQEISGVMRVDSSIDDTIDSDEPHNSISEDDNDEKYLPLANSSIVNLVDPTIKTDDSLVPTKHSDAPKEQNGAESKSFKEKHHAFVLQQKEELMLNLIDSTTDPCQDFYQYSCGGWENRFTLRPDQAVDNTFERLRDDLDSVLVSLLEEETKPDELQYVTTAKTLYKGCMNTEAIEEAGTKPLLDLLKDLGGWPVLEGEQWDASNFDAGYQMALLRNLNNEVLLAEQVTDDVANSSRRILQLDQPKLGLPGRNYFLSSSDHKYREAYLNLMLDSCELLGCDNLLAIRDMSEVLFFETELARLLVPAEERRNLSAIHRLYTRDELKTVYPGFNWDVYLDSVAPDHIEHTQEIRLFCDEYLHDFIRLLNKTDNRIVSNYLLWRLVKNRLGNLGSSALNIKEQYIKVLFGRTSQPNRWRSCISYVNGNLGGIVGAMFVERYFPEESRTDAEEMINLIREAFGETVYSAEWMLPDTRQTAMDKVQSIVWNVGYPAELLNRTHMQQMFQKLSFSPTSHFSNVLTMLRYHATLSHSLLGKRVHRTDWSASPATVNAYYSRTKNMIMFPAGILQPPFYHPAYPRALNYGGIGVVIGHEISHGFDDGGRQFDKRGTLKQWWSKRDVMAFYARATCMLEQYSEFHVTDLDMKVNAITTLGENIADNAGLDITYKAYQKWLKSNSDTPILSQLNMTLSQLFFLNFGQIWCEVNTPEAALTVLRSGRHSPNKFRVIGTLSNSEAFSNAFNCPLGSRMNPRDKCGVW